MKRWIPWWVALVLASVAAGAGWWIQQRGGDAAAAKDKKPPRAQAVKVTPVMRRDLRVWADAVGSVQPSAAVTVKSQVDGVLARVHFREGDPVAAGDLLAEIDPRPFEVALAKARGQLARDQALLDNARTDLARYQALLAKDAGSRQQADTQAALIRQYEGDLAMDRAAIEAAQLQLSWTRMTAPIGGRAGLRRIDAGNLVKAQDEAGIVLLTRMNPAQVVFALPETQALTLRGEKVEVQIWDSARSRILAQGHRLIRDNQIDSATGTLRMKAEIAGENLLANQFVQVRVLLQAQPQRLAVHAAALQRNGSKTQVFKLGPDNKVQAVPVRVGIAEGDWVAVEPLDGAELAAGDKVVTDGLERLRDGGEVKVVDADAGAKKAHKSSKPSKP